MTETINQYLIELRNIKDRLRNLYTFYDWFDANNITDIESLLNRDKKRIDTHQLQNLYINLKHRKKNIEETILQIEAIIKEFPSMGIEEQYKNFLNKELVSINWSDFYLISDRLTSFLEGLDDKLEDPNSLLEQAQYNFLDNIVSFLSKFDSMEKGLIDKISSIKIFNSLQGLERNIVIIGANGSGKSRFSRNLEGKIASGISIIPAQKLLVYKKPDNILINESILDKVKEFQQSSKMSNDFNFVSMLTEDLSNLIVGLFEEKISRAISYYETDKKEDSLLDTTTSIWENLIKHRKIVHDDKYNLHIETNDGIAYEFNELSDGEKAVFYYIGHVLLAKKDSYIVIDEPENHLHLSICTNLWDTLESIRSDCKFIYITHNLEFATSRNQKTLIWNKEYKPPFTWDFDIVKENDDVPEVLMLEIMGSKRNILFCEGNERNSLDYKIYSRLFENLNVIPVKGHEEVKKYCSTINNNKELSSYKAYGIIDGDAWSEEQIVSLERDNVYVLPFNEIENAICQRQILQSMVDNLYGEDDSVDNFMRAFFKEVNKQKEKISVWYANNKINNFLKANLFIESRDINKLKKEVEDFLGEEKIDLFYNEMFNKIEEDLRLEAFDSLIKYVNLKKHLTRKLGGDHIVNNFEDRFINLLDRNDVFRSTMFKLIVEPHFSNILNEQSTTKGAFI